MLSTSHKCSLQRHRQIENKRRIKDIPCKQYEKSGEIILMSYKVDFKTKCTVGETCHNDKGGNSSGKSNNPKSVCA